MTDKRMRQATGRVGLHRSMSARELRDYYIKHLARKAKRIWILPFPKHGRLMGFDVMFLFVLVLTTLAGVNTLTLPLGGANCGFVLPSSHAGRTVALVDQLSLELPDPNFVSRVQTLAASAGFGFEYYPSGTVTVDMLGDLPKKNYAMVVLREHAAQTQGEIITSDLYNPSERRIDQLLDRVGPALEVDGTVHFGILPRFITDVMCGMFPGTVILAMGCSTMDHTDLAKAFVRKGASAFIGWDRSVTIGYADRAFLSLIGMLLEGYNVGQTVVETMSRVGLDPVTSGRALYYPVTRASFRMETSGAFTAPA